MTLAFLVVFCLAVFRITHLVIADVFPPIKWARDKILKSKLPESILYLVECVWCSSVWIAGFGVLIFTPGMAVRERILLLFAASGVAALAEDWLD